MLGGELASYFINVMLLTAAIAPLVLWRYRRAVLAGMQGRSGEALALPPARPAPPASAADTPKDAPTDVPSDTPARAAPDSAAAARLAWEGRQHRRVLAAAGLATALPSLLLAAHHLWLGGQPTTPAHLWIKAAATCSVAVPIFAVFTATPFWRALRLWVGALVALAAGGVLLSMLQRPFYGKAPSLDQLWNFLIFFQLAGLSLWVPMLLGWATGARRVRGVAPITFAGLFAFGLAPLLGRHLTHWLSGTDIGTGWLLSGPGLETGFVIVALPMGLLAWRRLKALALAYEAKRFSDAQLLASTWWLLIVAGQAVELASVYPTAPALLGTLAVSAAAYAMFSPLLAWGLRRAQGREPRPPQRTLLLLRVFGDTARTEALFDRIALRWRWFGPVTLIAAPDVAARTVDPGDFLGFATGRIGASFVDSQADLDRRLATLDTQPDPDGRYRLNEFCCRDNSWSATVVALMQRADTVLMDLRGFTHLRMGCEFELRQLALHVPAGRVLLIVDSHTEMPLLEGYRRVGAALMPVVTVARGGSHDADATFAALLRAAG